VTASGSLAGRIAAACPCVGETACCGSLGGGCAGAGNCLWPGHALEREVEELETSEAQAVGFADDFKACAESAERRVAALETLLREVAAAMEENPTGLRALQAMNGVRAALKESDE